MNNDKGCTFAALLHSIVLISGFVINEIKPSPKKSA
jgi:hypothetical protein